MIFDLNINDLVKQQIIVPVVHKTGKAALIEKNKQRNKTNNTIAAPAESGMRVYLRDVIGVADVTVGGAGARRKAIQSEDMNVIEDLLQFDDEVIKTLYNSVHKPGGTIVDPTNANVRFPNPGINIPVIC